MELEGLRATPTATRRTRRSSGSGAGAGRGRCRSSIDATSCTQGIADPGEGVLDEENAERLAELEILDSIAWAHDRLLPGLEVSRKVELGRRPPDLLDPPPGPRRAACARSPATLADDVYVAPSATCCGFAGDRGISHPELTAAATRRQAEELAGRDFDAHLSSNRTCEIGLERATGERYESFVFLLERADREARVALCRAPRPSRHRQRCRTPASRSMRRSKSGLIRPRRAEM